MVWGALGRAAMEPTPTGKQGLIRHGGVKTPPASFFPGKPPPKLTEGKQGCIRYGGVKTPPASFFAGKPPPKLTEGRRLLAMHPGPGDHTTGSHQAPAIEMPAGKAVPHFFFSSTISAMISLVVLCMAHCLSVSSPQPHGPAIFALQHRHLMHSCAIAYFTPKGIGQSNSPLLYPSMCWGLVHIRISAPTPV